MDKMKMKKRVLEDLMCALAEMPGEDMAEYAKSKKPKEESYSMEIEMEMEDEDEMKKKKKKFMEA